MIQLAWSPPAGGDPRLVAMLDRMAERAEAIEHANAEALARLVGGEPRLMDCRPAWEALELPERVVLHSGPPIEWARMCEPMQAAVLCADPLRGLGRQRRRRPAARRGRAHPSGAVLITGAPSAR